MVRTDYRPMGLYQLGLDLMARITPFRVFVSHSKEDRKLAEDLKRAAARVDVEAYLFEDNPQYGMSVPKKIQDAISRSDVLLVFLTPKGSISPYVHQEVGFALGKGKKVIPVISGDQGEEALAMLVGREHLWLDGTNTEDQVADLVAYMEGNRADKIEGALRAALIVGGFFLWNWLFGGEDDEAEE